MSTNISKAYAFHSSFIEAATMVSMMRRGVLFRK